MVCATELPHGCSAVSLLVPAEVPKSTTDIATLEPPPPPRRTPTGLLVDDEWWREEMFWFFRELSQFHPGISNGSSKPAARAVLDTGETKLSAVRIQTRK